ncbi:unnamed protein product [Prorocentrum cordatum]|uniref:Pentacotripeptide-repeat region of PRORP domain-containing protein n=1 Tax=Prorocentrum cordatum TaxID=2364126 RepID=A0ABN9TZ26_9DINO|nr:unnamed protein product [Polarella glacialis]
MFRAGLAADGPLCVALLGACARRGDALRAEAWLRRLAAAAGTAELGTRGFTAVIGALMNVGDADRAHGWLREMEASGVQPDVVSYTAVVQAHLKAGRAAEAEALLHRMRAEGPRPNALSYGLVLGALAERCDGAAAERWYAAMLADIGLPDTVAHNAVLAACARAADAARVELWLGRTMPVGRLRPDEVTYTGNTVLDAYARGGSGEEVEARFLQLTAGAEPWVSARTFAIRMRPWAYAGDSARVEQQWREMEALGVRPEACNMWALLTALARARPPRAEAAARRYQESGRPQAARRTTTSCAR